MDKTVIKYVSDPLDEAEREGKEIYKTHSVYRKISNVMEHPEFRQFFDEYFQDWDMAKIMIMFMKTYQSIEQSLEDKYKNHINGYHKLYVLDRMFKDKDFRKFLCGKMKEWSTSENFIE